MNKKYKSNRRAILILESPWELDSADTNRSSVLPFVEGIAKLAGNTDVFHANFYDAKSFKQALDCLLKIEFDNAIVYVAAHGDSKVIGNVKIIEALVNIGERARGKGITGIVLGSCTVGGNTSAIEVCVEGTQLRWAVGYSSTTWWLEGTFIDCSIMANMLELDGDDFSDQNIMISALAQAIAPFSENYCIGMDESDSNVLLKDSLQFVIQPLGRGKRSKLVNDEVFTEVNCIRAEV